MSRDILLSLLRQGSTGSEILQILETISTGVDDDDSGATVGEPTINPIQF